MSILSDNEILKAMERGSIVVDPFRRENLGPNSYDVHLSKHVATYQLYKVAGGFVDLDSVQGIYYAHPLDAKYENNVRRFEIPDEGFVFRPGVLYLCSTEEYTETHEHVPYVDGRSSVGRLGVQIHLTAGRGDVGFCGAWTLEVAVVHPIRVYAGMPIGQLTFHTVLGEVLNSYDKRSSSSYNNRDGLPIPSMLWKKFRKEEK